MIGLAETGSGKTLAFTLPGLHLILTRWGAKPPKIQKPMVSLHASDFYEAGASCNVSSIFSTAAAAAAAAPPVGNRSAMIENLTPSTQ